MTVFSFSYNFSVGLGNLKPHLFQVEKKKIFHPRCVIWRFSFWGLYCFFKLLVVIRSALHSAELRWAQVPREAQHHPGKCEPMPSISTALYKAWADKNGQWREEDEAKRKKKISRKDTLHSCKQSWQSSCIKHVGLLSRWAPCDWVKGEWEAGIRSRRL